MNAETIRAAVRILREKYGGNHRQAINRAIRAELVGGDDLLDALGLLARIELRLDERGMSTDTVSAAVKAVVDVRHEFEGAVLRKVIHEIG